MDGDLRPPRARSRNTRQRIVEAALRLFNERHFGNVTTSELAAEVGIAEGNLWYHFRNKRALLDELSGLYVERARGRLVLSPGQGDILDAYADMLRAMTGEVRDFRFIFRDRADFGELSPQLAQNLASIYGGTWRQMSDFFKAMRAAGHLSIADEWIGAHVSNAILIIRFSLEFFRELNVEEVGSDHAAWGVVQHLAALGEMLEPAARDHLVERLGLAGAMEKAKAMPFALPGGT
ncbi:TetR/AcrR family transcriptional regulator [Zavarzinia sp.]|uniref:TetR/AcrR family transcriptional regulator n=1 Tax=Zavarzinia sp. TaxID=2027920 RepID=UPI003BB7D31F